MSTPTDQTIRRERGIIYPQEAWYGIAVFLVGVGIFQWGTPSKPAPRRESTTMPARTRGALSLWRVPLAAVNAYRVLAFRWTLEIGSYTLTMAEVFFALAYIAYLFTWTFVNTTDLEGKILDLKYWSNRVACLVVSQTPLLTALGTKNNVVSLVTGISYEKLNYVHRVVARTCFVLLLFHASTEVYNISRPTWLRMGITAMVALGILCAVSLRPIRTAAYECFYYVHFLMVLIFLVGGYVHAQDFLAVHWIWPSFIVWGLDRLIRVARLVVFNHLYFGFKRHSGELDATTELLCDDFVRVRMHRPPHFNWSAGQSAYLIVPSISTLPFEAHPFSIASIDSALFSPDAGNPRDDDVSEKSQGPPSPKTMEQRGDAYWKELVFLVNVRGGFTKRLKDAAAQNKTVKVLLDGPYGAAPDLGAYDTAVLISGGTGITYTLPVFLSVIEAVRKGTSSCRRLVFDLGGHLHWISDALFRANSLVPPSLTGSLPSREESDSVDQDNTIENKTTASESILSASWITMSSGRPDLKAILREEVNGAVGRMSVSVCGSQGLAGSVRHALRFPVSGMHSILRGGPSVTLYVESFGYA
ncbi:hypothetical protein BU15DRAFT_88459 [Melanogaster broomeanus]|nr:hypothetical protein BU15DRAFT_88459 [Melanogaster broomeanus]